MTTEIVPKPKVASIERAERELQRIENEIVSEASMVVHGTMRFADIDPENPDETPEAWRAELAAGTATMEEIEKRKRIARAAWLSAKEAPVAFAIASKVLVGAMKAKAMAGAAPKNLNLTLVSISAPGQTIQAFPEKEIKHE